MDYVLLIRLLFWIIVAFIILYHMIYSSFKMNIKSGHIYEMISSNIKIINKLYFNILFLTIVFTIFTVLYFFYWDFNLEIEVAYLLSFKYLMYLLIMSIPNVSNRVKAKYE